MARTRGHTRRKKSRLTTQTLSAAIEVGRRRDAVDTGDDSATANLGDFDILDLLRAEPDALAVPAAYNDAGSVFTGAQGFPADRFVLGLLVCPACRNEVVYYQDRDRLAAGYHFRCRVCQHALVATLP